MVFDDNKSGTTERFDGPPSGYFVIVDPSSDKATTIDLRRVVAQLRKHIIILMVLPALLSIAAGIVVWHIPNKYKAQSLVVLATASGSGSGALNGLRSQVGGLAALAGVDLGPAGGRGEESIAILGSRGLAREFIQNNSLLPVLFSDRWDAQQARWRPNVKVPSLEDGVDLFIQHIRSISPDKKTGIISVSVEWVSPSIAARWANDLIDATNEKQRAAAISEAEQNIKYLKEELAHANTLELQQTMYRLMESQVNQAMLANVQRQYAFRVIDKAVPPEKKTSPSRIIIVFAVAIGSHIAVFMILFVYYIAMYEREDKKRKLDVVKD